MSDRVRVTFQCISDSYSASRGEYNADNTLSVTGGVHVLFAELSETSEQFRAQDGADEANGRAGETREAIEHQLIGDRANLIESVVCRMSVVPLAHDRHINTLQALLGIEAYDMLRTDPNIVMPDDLAQLINASGPLPRRYIRNRFPYAKIKELVDALEVATDIFYRPVVAQVMFDRASDDDDDIINSVHAFLFKNIYYIVAETQAKIQEICHKIEKRCALPDDLAAPSRNYAHHMIYAGLRAQPPDWKKANMAIFASLLKTYARYNTTKQSSSYAVKQQELLLDEHARNITADYHRLCRDVLPEAQHIA